MEPLGDTEGAMHDRLARGWRIPATPYDLRAVAIEAAADAVLDHWVTTGRIGPTLTDRSAHSGEAIAVATVCIDRADRALCDLAALQLRLSRRTSPVPEAGDVPRQESS